MKLGLKLWSRNENYVEPAVELYKKGIYDYIELFAVPGSASYLNLWEAMDIPFILHAPHSLAGFNPSIKERASANFALLSELDQFRKALNPKYIIFHPGVDGSADETIRQFCEIRNKFPEIHKLAIIENKPEVGLHDERCVGSSPQEITRIMQEASMGFCFDVGHAICAANSAGLEPHSVLRDFINLQPLLFHLSDGTGNSPFDSHMNYGFGNYDFREILQLLPNDAQITIETDKASDDNLDDFVKDVEYLSKLT